jgi:hypothetical protein
MKGDAVTTGVSVFWQRSKQKLIHKSPAKGQPRSKLTAARPNLAGTKPLPRRRRETDPEMELPTRTGIKHNNLPVWLREAIGWGMFLVLIGLFLWLQIFLNGIFSGPANKIVIGLSVVLEIFLVWLWDWYWY